MIVLIVTNGSRSVYDDVREIVGQDSTYDEDSISIVRMDGSDFPVNARSSSIEILPAAE